MGLLSIATCLLAWMLDPARVDAPATDAESLQLEQVPGLVEHLDAHASPPDTIDPSSAPGETWRLVRHNGAWWYWLPSKRWVAWNQVRWVDPVDLPPPGWNPLFYVPQFDRPFPGVTLWTAEGLKVYAAGDQTAACLPQGD